MRVFANNCSLNTFVTYKYLLLVLCVQTRIVSVNYELDVFIKMLGGMYYQMNMWIILQETSYY